MYDNSYEEVRQVTYEGTVTQSISGIECVEFVEFQTPQNSKFQFLVPISKWFGFCLIQDPHGVLSVRTQLFVGFATAQFSECLQRLSIDDEQHKKLNLCYFIESSRITHILRNIALSRLVNPRSSPLHLSLLSMRYVIVWWDSDNSHGGKMKSRVTSWLNYSVSQGIMTSGIL